ncbi:MAG: glycosyltransferase [Deltaproteobacteria bacterium]|nr:glycosyltransferase [Deltaproteobacteria bacterium]
MTTDKGPPLVTVVTPVLNGARFIRRTIRSVLEQKGNFILEYIICDGGSTDATLSIVKEFGDHCRLIQLPGGGPQEAINFALAQARGAIAGWLGADDLLAAGALDLVVKAFGEHPENDWLYGRCRIIDECGQEIRRWITMYKNLLGRRFSRRRLQAENFINQPATFWRMTLWRRCGGLNRRYQAAFDYDLWLRFAACGPPLVLLDYLASFRRHPASISERGYAGQFAEELAICKREASPLVYQLHRFNAYKIITVYHCLAGLSQLKNKIRDRRS